MGESVLDERLLRRLASQGWSSRDIGRKVGLTQQAVARRCRLLGVTLFGRSSPRYTAKNSRNMRRRHRGGKVLTRGEWSRWNGARESRRMGWPQVARVGEARVLDALWRHGPMTRAEISARLGLSLDARGQATTCCSRHVRALREAGLIAVVGYRPVPRNRPRWVFGLAPGVRPADAGAASAAYPDKFRRGRCEHDLPDGECPHCERGQRGSMVFVSEESQSA